MRTYRCFGPMRLPDTPTDIEAESEAAAAEEYARRRDAADGSLTAKRIVLMHAGARYLRFDVECNGSGLFTDYRATLIEIY